MGGIVLILLVLGLVCTVGLFDDNNNHGNRGGGRFA